MPKSTSTIPTPIRLNAQDLINIKLIRRRLPHLHSAREAISVALATCAEQLKRDEQFAAEEREALRPGLAQQ